MIITNETKHAVGYLLTGFICGAAMAAGMTYAIVSVRRDAQIDDILVRHNLYTLMRDIDGVPRKIPTPHWRTPQ